MRRIAVTCSAIAACTGALVAIGPAGGTAIKPLTIVYDSTATTRTLVFPAHGAGLSPSRGALRQDPGIGGMLAPGNNSTYRIAKVSGAALAGMSAQGMAATLESQIRLGTYGAQSHLVAIDELTESYGDPPAPGLRRNEPLPPIATTGPGARFTDAMRILAAQQSPWGGTWASRVEVYISPGVVTSIARGRGPNHNLNALGIPQFRTWRAVMPGLALAGGLHLEMYHGSGTPLAAFTAAQWRSAPRAFLGLLGEYHGSASRVHFVFSATTRPAGAPRTWGNAMEATWTLARATAAGREILDNGPDEYRLGGHAGQWLTEYDRQFPVR